MMKSKLPLHTGLQNTIIAVASAPTLCNAVTLPILSHIHSTRFTTMSLHNLFPLPEMIRLNPRYLNKAFSHSSLGSFPSPVPSTQHISFSSFACLAIPGYEAEENRGCLICLGTMSGEQ